MCSSEKKYVYPIGRFLPFLDIFTLYDPGMLALHGTYAPTILHTRQSGRGSSFPMGNKPFYRLVFVEEAFLTFVVDGADHLAREGDVVLLPPQHDVTAHGHDDARWRLIAFTVLSTSLIGKRMAFHMAPDATPQPGPRTIWNMDLSIVVPTAIRQDVSDIISLITQTCWLSPIERLAGNRRLSFILEHIVRGHADHAAATNSTTGIITRVHLMVTAEFSKLHTTADIAHGLGISSSLLKKRYAAESDGHSAIELLKSARLSETARLLLDTTHSVERIARLVGFRNGKALAKSWQRQHGMPPRRWRIQHRRSH